MRLQLLLYLCIFKRIVHSDMCNEELEICWLGIRVTRLYNDHTVLLRKFDSFLDLF